MVEGLKKRKAEVEVLVREGERSAWDELERCEAAFERHESEGESIVDWTSRRITAILENALLEDRATRDATTYACIDPNQRASATILAKQDCVLSGLGCIQRILDVFAQLDGTVTSHPEVTQPSPRSSTACACAKGNRSRSSCTMRA